MALNYRPDPQLKLSLATTYRSMNLSRRSPLASDFFERINESLPEQMFSLTGSWLPAERWRLSFQLRYLGDDLNGAVPEYTELNALLVWKVSEHWELRLSGKNLLNPGHLEVISELGQAVVEMPRKAYFEVRLRF